MIHKYVLYRMFEIYGEPTVDWMGYEVTDNNPITYHHIIEVEHGGKETVNNGALLTQKAHRKLHRIQHSHQSLYEEYQYWFRTINDMKCPPTEEVMEIMRGLKKRLNTALEVDRIVKRDAKTYVKQPRRSGKKYNKSQMAKKASK